jgi:hypothetical protein
LPIITCHDEAAMTNRKRNQLLYGDKIWPKISRRLEPLEPLEPWR